MNRAARRAAAREAAKHARRNGTGKLPPRCPPGEHAFAKLVGTVAGAAAATRVICSKCRRTFQQVMEESPEDLELYRTWLAKGEPEEEESE